jgi:hypothetical protein
MSLLIKLDSANICFTGSNKTTEGTNPLFGKVKSSGPSGKSVDKGEN